MLMQIYKIATICAEPLLRWHVAKRLKRGREETGRVSERFGIPSRARGAKPLVWFHAASVGESLSILPLVNKIVSEMGAEVMVTTCTFTSAKMMKEKLPQGAFHQYIPLDHPQWVENFLDSWKPNMVIWLESEIWPNMLQAVKNKKIPAMLLNVRLSDKSFSKWRFAKGLFREVASAFQICIGPKSEVAKLNRLGVTWTEEFDNLKYCTRAQPYDEAKLEHLKEIVGERPSVLWSATHAGEEEIAMRIHKALSSKHPGLLSVILPRHPNRKQEIVDLAKKMFLGHSVRSEGKLPSKTDEIYIADTMGETGLFYKLSNICVMGGSFTIGGHNIIEPAHCACKLLYGPLMYNFANINEDFLARKASLQLGSEDELQVALEDVLGNPGKYDAMAQEALKLAREKEQIINKLFARISPMINEAIAKE